MSLERDKSRLDKIASQLYSRNAKEFQLPKNPKLSNHETEVKTDWGTPEPEYDGPDDLRNQGVTNHWVRKFFLLALVFFIFASGIAAFIYYRGNNIISASNIDIVISGPATIAGGEKLDLDIEVKNQNPMQIEKADLTILYPEGTRNADNVALEQTRQYKILGPIEPSASASSNIKAIMYGEENSKQTVKVVLSYRVKGSNALLEKEKEFEVFLTTAPVSVRVTSLKEVNSGQEIEFTAEVTSNSSSRLNSVMLKADYGFGFTFISANPKPSFGKDLWLVGDLRPGEKRTIKVRGKIEGQDGEERTFRFSAGIQSERGETILEPVFLTVAQTVQIQKPFIGVQLALNGDTSSTISTRNGRRMQASIAWVNNLPSRISNVKISAKLIGPALDRNSIVVNEGFFQSLDNTVVWDRSTDSGLATVSPGDSGSVNFEFATLAIEPSLLAQFKNSEVTIEISVRGQRGESNVPEEILSTVSRKIKINSELAVSPRIVFSTGPFPNTGSVPARAEQQTTYTVVLAVTNGINDVRDVRVRAMLPSYVKWLGKVSPESAGIEFDQTSGEVVWSVGEVPAGEGYASQPKQVAFQIGFTPSISQVGTTPVLVNEISVEGVDRFAGSALEQTKGDLTTRLITDPVYANTGSNVVR